MISQSRFSNRKVVKELFPLGILLRPKSDPTGPHLERELAILGLAEIQVTVGTFLFSRDSETVTE